VGEGTFDFRIDFSSGGNSEAYLGDGWHGPERTHRWTSAERSTLHVPIPHTFADLCIEIDLWPAANQSEANSFQRFLIFAGRHFLGEFTLSARNTISVQVPAEVLNVAPYLKLSFEAQKPLVPSKLDPDSQDHRPLALAFVQATLSYRPDETRHVDPLREVAVLKSASERVRSGESGAALSLLREAWRAGLDPVWIFRELITLATDQGDLPSVITRCEWFLANRPGDDGVSLILALNYLMAGRPRSAICTLNSQTSREPSRQILFELGNAFRAAGQLDVAVRFFNRLGANAHPHWVKQISDARADLHNARTEILSLLRKPRKTGAFSARMANLLLSVGRISMAKRLLSSSGGARSGYEWLEVSSKIILQEQGVAEALRHLQSEDPGLNGSSSSRLAGKLELELGSYDRAKVHWLKDYHLTQDSNSFFEASRSAYLGKDSRGFQQIVSSCLANLAGDVTNARLVISLAASGAFSEKFKLLGTAPRPDSTRPSELLQLGLVQFWDTVTVPPDVLACINSWRVHHPKIHHDLFSEADAHDFLVRSFGTEIGAMFGQCHHPAMKADFFRLFYLLERGGIYIDADDVCLTSLDGLVKDTFKGNLIVSLSRDFPMYVHNWFIGCGPQHPVISYACDEMITILRNDRRKGSRPDIWHTTGPGVLTRAVAKYLAGSCNTSSSGRDVVGIPLALLRRHVAPQACLEYQKRPSGNWRVAF
jgi:tetratricopeptide (TPR) repeat protein